MIKLTVEGVVYEFDGDRLLLAEAREIKTFTGLTIPKWSSGIDEGDPDAIAALIYLAKKRAGEAVRFSDLDSIDIAAIDMEPIGADSEQQTAADPTLPSGSGTTSMPASGATSVSSPTASSTILATSTV